MKKRVFVSAILLLTILLSGCTMLPWVKDANNIYDWFTLEKKGTEFRYKDVYTDIFSTVHTGYFIVKVLDTEEKNDKKIMTVSYDDATRYFVADKDENLVFFGRDEYFEDTDEDEVLLDTPVEEDSKWYYKSEERKIESMNEDYETEAGEFTGLIKVEFSGNGYNGYYYYSVQYGIIFSRTDYDGGGYSYTELVDIDE